jgi:hypothetical protein
MNNKIFAGLFSVIVFITIVGIGIVILTQITSSGYSTTYTSNFVNNGTETIEAGTGNGITSSSVSVYNQTWLNLNGLNSSVNVTINQSKATISLWFKNESYDWTSVIISGTDIYVNNISNSSWTFFPYYIVDNNLVIGKFDATTFFNGSIDEFRIYENKLNVSEVNAVYNEGH